MTTMNNFGLPILNRLFVALFVGVGYAKYYIGRITWKSVVTACFAVLLITSLLVFFSKPPKDGNLALNQGYELRNNGKMIAAHDAFEKAYDIFVEQNYPRGMFVSLNALAETDLTYNNHTEALTHFDGALRLAKQYGDRNSQIRLFEKHAELKLLMGRTNAARAHYYDALKIAQDDNLNAKIASLFTKVGNLERGIGNDRKARFAYRNALKGLETAIHKKEEAEVYLSIGTLEDELDNYQAAITSYVTARTILKQQGNIFDEATVLTQMARLEKKLGSIDKAADYYLEAETLLASIGRTEAMRSVKSEAASL